MELIRLSLEKGFNIDYFLDQRYNEEQLERIRLGLEY